MKVFVLVCVAIAMTQGSTTPLSVTEGCLPGHSEYSLLYNLLQAAGFQDNCVTGVLEYCSAGQEEAHYPSILQVIQEVKDEVQEGKVQLQEVNVALQEVKDELNAMKTDTQEGIDKVQQEVQEEKVELQEVKGEVEEVKGMLQQVMLMLNNVSQPSHCVELLDSGNRSTVSQPRHCKELLDSGDRGSGLRHVYPYSGRPNHSVTVYCEQDVDGGGWTIFQRRINNTVREDFFRNWTEYQAGFGDLNGEFWLGLDILHELTRTQQELRVELEDYKGAHRWAKYGTFQVGSADTNYRLTIGRYSGNAGDSMTNSHNGQEFSTHDADHDKHYHNCANKHRGAWWYNYCHSANLNGYQYVGDNTPYGKGISWYEWRGQKYSLRQTAMMVRPAL